MTSPHSVPGPSRATEIARLELARLAPSEPLDAVFRRACELCADALTVERVGVWLFIDNGGALRCANLFERSKKEHSAGTMLRVADFPAYFTSISIRKAVPAEVAGTEPWTAELAARYLRPLGIGSILDAGIFVDGELVGVLCHEHVGLPREWTTEARDFVGSMADLLALRIQSAEVRELRAAFLTQDERSAAHEKAAALEQLAAGVAHDFRNLLTVFLGYGGLLARRDDLPHDARKQAKDIVTAAEQGTALAKGLLEFAHPQTAPPAVLDLGAVAAEFMPVLKAAIGSKYKIQYTQPDELGQVFIEKGQFTRLLLNLAVNASEAMPEGGLVTIRLAPVKLTGNPSYLGRFVLLEVTDTGTGIDAETQRRMFDPYFTTKSKGTGLGLAIVRRIVDRVGGLIRVESSESKGTTFRVFFPRVGASTGGTALFPILPPQLGAEPA
ncbi:ATP-binding protein [Gemmata sp. JC673]|uniref:histidine kinase n=1 Tax=Gemmata algarum TaxID=2975278 RepID=A0ABU5F323_9BACT|nr:ATP-binding protein [Gemmata algarum]MDY3561909.1 ATP-binding protein [Gemmata algarum]